MRSKRINALQIEKLGQGVYYADPNLYLRVRGNSRLWVFRYSRGGRVRLGDKQEWHKGTGVAREIGLGKATSENLKDARDRAADIRRALAKGLPPESVLGPRRGEQVLTFAQYATRFIADKIAPAAKSDKHVNLWTNSLEQYAIPKLGNKRPRDITRDDVLAVLKPIWEAKHETASRVQMRMERVIQFALVTEDLSQSNPASWKGNLENFLPLSRKITEVIRRPAAKYTDVPAIMAELRKRETTSALCLLWTTLTAARSGESRGATWSEVDETAKVWRLSKERMKAHEAHDVPLCDEAMQVLDAMKERRVPGCDYIFPGERNGKDGKRNCITDVAVNKVRDAVMKALAMDYEITTHGFRRSFRNWGSETRRDRDLLELSLAHTIASTVEGRYNDAKLLQLRRDLLQAWADYCNGKNNVVQLVQATA